MLEVQQVVALITIEVHARDVIEKLHRANCKGIADFEWVSQLRHYWNRDASDCVIKLVCSTHLHGNQLHAMSPVQTSCSFSTCLQDLLFIYTLFRHLSHYH